MLMGYEFFIYQNYTKYMFLDIIIVWLIDGYIRNDSIFCFMQFFTLGFFDTQNYLWPNILINIFNLVFIWHLSEKYFYIFAIIIGNIIDL